MFLLLNVKEPQGESQGGNKGSVEGEEEGLCQDGGDDLIDVRGKFLKHIYIQTGIIRELVRFGVNYNWKRQIVRIVHGGLVTIPPSGQTIPSFPHKEIITVDGIYLVTRKVSGMDLDGIDEADDSANEGLLRYME